jgi:predicted membrane protein
MDTRQNSFFAPRFVLGMGIVLIGMLFLLGNLDIIDSHDYFRFWPAILIVLGIAYLFQSQQGSGRVWGIILIFIGSAMVLDRLYFINFHVWDYWPLILIFAGIMMILKASSRQKSQPFTQSEVANANSYINATAILGGFKQSNNSQDFRGGNLTAIMGGLEIDLRNASIKGEAVFDIFAMMGGVEMRVPEDWLVVIEGFPFMGGYENKTYTPKEATKRLVIKGTAVMGGVEIKN